MITGHGTEKVFPMKFATKLCKAFNEMSQPVLHLFLDNMITNIKSVLFLCVNSRCLNFIRMLHINWKSLLLFLSLGN